MALPLLLLLSLPTCTPRPTIPTPSPTHFAASVQGQGTPAGVGELSPEEEEELKSLQVPMTLTIINLSMCTIFLVIYALVAGFVFRKIGFKNTIMSLMLVSIGMVLTMLTAFFVVVTGQYVTLKREIETHG